MDRDKLCGAIGSYLWDNVRLEEDNYDEVTDAIMALFDAAAASEWTACKDAMPADGVHVLAWAPRDDPVNRFSLAYRSGGHWYMTGASHSPMYWRLLDEPAVPAPPAGKEE